MLRLDYTYTEATDDSCTRSCYGGRRHKGTVRGALAGQHPAVLTATVLVDQLLGRRQPRLLGPAAHRARLHDGRRRRELQLQ